MIVESSRGTEARWTDGTADCPGGARARVERPNQLDVASECVARLNRSYAWGLDASGTLTGAGGVGGLVLTSHHTPQADGSTQVTTLAPLYDFNGNVLAYADVATSTITHRIEYDPFGQELSLDTLLPGEGAAEAPRFRFSTKYTDGETGLVYYGYRSYSPELGRWVNRDPIEEEGGINLYGMVGNDAVSRVDVLGLDTFRVRRRLGGGPASHPDKLFAHEFVLIVDLYNGGEAALTTYSWGNSGEGLNRWFVNRQEDLNAAVDALSSGLARWEGGADLDICVREAFSEIGFDEKSNHMNWLVTSNCKTESCKLIDKARMILRSTRSGSP